MTDPLARAFADHFATAARKAAVRGDYRTARTLGALADDCWSIETPSADAPTPAASAALGGPVVASAVTLEPAP